MKAIVLCLLLWALSQASRAAIVTYTSQGPHSIHDGAAIFALPIDVANIVEPVIEITVTFTDLFHTHPADIDVLLVGPGGQKVMLMSDVGELLSEEASIIDDVNLVFRDGAMALPPNTRITSGTYAPTNYQGVIEDIGEMDQNTPAMPPPGPYGLTFSVFNGENPNGTWKLFIQDDLEDEGGSLGAWSLTVVTVPEPTSTFCLLAVGGALLIRRLRVA
jgi:subtilisin-like proprotein convertase family protein